MLMPSAARIYLIDKEFNVVSYELLLSVLDYKTMVVRRDFDAAAAILPQIPLDHHNKIARFLEGQHPVQMMSRSPTIITTNRRASCRLHAIFSAWL